jgi:hypothetical protein
MAANAGSDMLLCIGAQSMVQLNGSFVASLGAQWSNGSGTYSPNNATMNAYYTPSAAEISTGGVTLSLITTVTRAALLIPTSSHQYWTTRRRLPFPDLLRLCVQYRNLFNYSPDHVTYSWNITGGTITGVTASSINVRWGNAGSERLTLTATHSSGVIPSYHEQLQSTRRLRL